MCFYITATFPKGTQVEKFRQILEKYEMEFSPIHNPKVQSQLRPDELYFRATKNYCDCDTVLGSMNSLQDFQTLSKSKKVKALKKKNLSEKEIKDWITTKLKSKQNGSGKKLSPLERKNETERWIQFLNDLIGNKIVSRIGILKHWYEKGLEDEEIKISKTQKITINTLSSDLLLNLSEDTLYEFFPVYKF
ncbi:MAG: hypothetical protein ACFE8B_03790 [Candidatus Hermodarchaeota archaeon]